MSWSFEDDWAFKRNAPFPHFFIFFLPKLLLVGGVYFYERQTSIVYLKKKVMLTSHICFHCRASESTEWASCASLWRICGKDARTDDCGKNVTFHFFMAQYCQFQIIHWACEIPPQSNEACPLRERERWSDEWKGKGGGLGEDSLSLSFMF